jgi:hypothetical protein
MEVQCSTEGGHAELDWNCPAIQEGRKHVQREMQQLNAALAAFEVEEIWVERLPKEFGAKKRSPYIRGSA